MKEYNQEPFHIEHGITVGRVMRWYAEKLGYSDEADVTPDEAMALYDRHADATLQLMLRKNHDYGEAWRGMRVSSYTDLILTKIQRVKEIEDLGGQTLVSEGIGSNYMDIINYALFGIIKLSE